MAVRKCAENSRLSRIKNGTEKEQIKYEKSNNFHIISNLYAEQSGEI